MKKSGLVIILFCISHSLFSQNFNAGMRFGVCASQVDGDRLVGFDKAGVIGGLFVNRDLSKSFTLQMEMVYIQKGSRKPTDINNSFYLLRVNYVEVPLILQWHLTPKFSLAAGPSFATLVGSHEENEYGVFNSNSSFKKFELSGNFGLVYKLSDNWSFDGRYNNSLTTIRPFPGVTTAFFDRGQYNVSIQLSLLYSF